MKSQPLVSILIANYNNGVYFEECWKSILSQTYTNWEVIIVDDNSNDGTCDIINKINNPKIKLFRRSGRGLSSAFLLGLIN